MDNLSYAHTPLTKPLDGRLWHHLLEVMGDQCPNKEAVIMYDMDMTRSAMTFAEFRDRTCCVASSILDLGLSRGNRVLLIGENSIPYMVFIIALHRIGANAILLGPGSLTPNKVNLLKNLNCKMIVYDSNMKESQRNQLIDGIKELLLDGGEENMPIILVTLQQEDQELTKVTFCHTYENLLKKPTSEGLQNLLQKQNDVQFDDPIVAVFTSGSTGKPKVVQNSTHAIINRFMVPPFEPPTVSDGKFYMDRPLSWLGGYIIALAPFARGTTVVSVPPEMVYLNNFYQSVFNIWEREKCMYCIMNTSLITALASDPWHHKYNFTDMKLVVIGGQRYQLPLVTTLTEAFPRAKILLGYGATECLSVTMEIIGKEDVVEYKYGKMSVTPGTEVKLVDDDNKVVPRGTVGEICVRSARMFLTYMDNPEATRLAKSATGWLYTGDTAVMDENNKIKVMGRKTEIIKRATVKIIPQEIEKTLSQHPHVQDVVVVGIPDQRLNEEICACVVLKRPSGSSSADDDELIKEVGNWCEERWPSGPDGLSLKPKYFIPMNDFPFTKTGKVFIKEIKTMAMKQLGIGLNVHE